VVGEIARTLVITYVLVRLIARLGGGDWKGALSRTVSLYFGFSAMMWVGRHSRGVRADRAPVVPPWKIVPQLLGNVLEWQKSG
jgi:hypothetical protein